MTGTGRDEVPMSARVPADIERPDTLIAGLGARQLVLLGATGVVLWLGFQATRTLVTPVVFLAVALPIFGAVMGVALVRRDGVPLDRLLVAWWRQRRAPHRLVPADPDTDHVPDAPAWVTADAGELPALLRLPAAGIETGGVVDLGPDGTAAVAVCSTVNFSLRSPSEQNVLVAGFARWLHSLTGPAQIVVRSNPLDLTPLTRRLRETAPGLPHPALETAALDHAGFLDALAADRDLLRRQVLLVLREPTTAAEGVVARRAADAANLLGSADVTVTPLNSPRTGSVMAAAVDPWSAPSANRAGPATHIVTLAGSSTDMGAAADTSEDR